MNVIVLLYNCIFLILKRYTLLNMPIKKIKYEIFNTGTKTPKKVFDPGVFFVLGKSKFIRGPPYPINF